MDGRFIRFLLLSFIAFALYTLVRAKLYPPEPPARTAPASAAPAAGASAPAQGEVPPPAVEPEDPWRALPPVPAQGVVAQEPAVAPALSAERWTARLDAKGGTISQWILHPDPAARFWREGHLLEEAAERRPGALALLAGGRVLDLSAAPWTPGESGTFSLGLANGLAVRKRFEKGPGPDEIVLRVAFLNEGKEEAAFVPRLSVAAGLRLKEDRQDVPYAVEGVVLERRPDGSLRRLTKHAGDVKEGPAGSEPGEIAWAGAFSRYYFVAARPEKGSGPLKGVWEAFGKDRQELSLWLELPEIKLPPGASAERSVGLVCAPRLAARVEAYPDLGALAANSDLTAAIQAPLFWVMKGLYRLTGNFGVAILLLTLAVRAVLHPLSFKQQSSMRKFQEKMKRMQPKLTEIQERYKKDARRRNEEMMKLYKEHGNPMGGMLKGCLPLLLQMPILIALYNVIGNAVELRGAPFAFWMMDLSLPDRLLSFPPGVHFLFIAVEDLNLLPILMAGAQFLQMYITPTPPSPDPEMARQQKVTQYIMFGFFAFLFYNMSSGLVLYWLMSTVLGILEFRWISARLARAAKA